jgi:hypothetical protein
VSLSKFVVIVVGVVVLSGCTTGAVKSAQSLGLSFAYKTKKVCPESTDALKKITYIVDGVGCYVEGAKKYNLESDLSTEIGSLQTGVSTFYGLQRKLESVSTEFCDLRKQGVKKVKDDNPLFDRYFAITE